MIHRLAYTTLTQAAMCVMLLGMAHDVTAQCHRLVSYHSSPSRNGTHSESTAYLSDDVDEQPQFPGGDAAMLQYINRERTYPAAEYNAGIQGRVVCSFIVGTDGRVQNVEVIRGCTDGLNREAVRIIRNMPRWEAGKVNGEEVPVYCILPIPFRL